MLFNGLNFDVGALILVLHLICRAVKVAASLLSPTAFALGTINFADYERAHVGVRWSNIWEVGYVSYNEFCFSIISWIALAFQKTKSISVDAGFIWS
jgi:hypothetical protein